MFLELTYFNISKVNGHISMILLLFEPKILCKEKATDETSVIKTFHKVFFINI